MMKEMEESHQVPKDFPLGNVSFMEVEPPEFGNSNEPSEATRRFADLIRGLGQKQLVLCAEQYACMANSEEPPSADFKEIPAFAEGREQSRHGVMFGRLNIETRQDPPITTFVAMKPYDRRGKDSNFGARPDRAVAHDWATNQHLRKLSTSGAYEPIGLWRGEGTYPVPGLITRFNERSLSLDNLLRALSLDRDGQPDAGVSLLRARQALHLGHFGLGVAHGIRVTHGDAAPQNFATDGSHIIFNDTTTIQPFASTQRKNEVRAAADMEDFVSGSIHPDVTTEEMRALTGSALKDTDFRSGLYESYLAGAALGGQRAGFAKSGGVLVPEPVHTQIVDRFIQKYVPA
jgi:hypothetical protein